jgi:hypothetical protein
MLFFSYNQVINNYQCSDSSLLFVIQVPITQ